jgi:amino acid transporter
LLLGGACATTAYTIGLYVNGIVGGALWHAAPIWAAQMLLIIGKIYLTFMTPMKRKKMIWIVSVL